MVYHKEVVRHSLGIVLFAIETMTPEELAEFKETILFNFGLEPHEAALDLCEVFTKIWKDINDDA